MTGEMPVIQTETKTITYEAQQVHTYPVLHTVTHAGIVKLSQRGSRVFVLFICIVWEIHGNCFPGFIDLSKCLTRLGLF